MLPFPKQHLGSQGLLPDKRMWYIHGYTRSVLANTTLFIYLGNGVFTLSQNKKILR